MAVTPRHSKDLTPLVDEKDLSGFLTSVDMSASLDPTEVTTFASNGDRQYVGGLRDVEFSMEGLFAASTTAADDIVNYLDGSFAGSSKNVITIDVDGTTGGRCWMLQGDANSYDINSPVDGIVALSAGIQGSNGYAGGRMLRPLKASTSTGSQSAVATPGTTSAGGTTGGGVAHLHVTSVASTFASVTFRIQHSTSGSTWATLHTFTAATAATFQRSTISGTIKEQVRATISSYTATTGADTVTAAVALSRRVRT